MIGAMKVAFLLNALLAMVEAILNWTGHVARMEEKRNVYRLLVGKSEGERPLARPRRTWTDNIKIDLLEIGLSVVVWIGLAQDKYR
jgi:hypothetical protein